MAREFEYPWPSPNLLHRVKENVGIRSESPTCEVNFVVSPYRICPLGAHIDHQGGSVTAMAINRGVVLGFVPSDDTTVVLTSSQFSGTVHFSLDNLLPARPSRIHVTATEDAWGDYARGAAFALQNKGYKLTKGIRGYMEGSRGFDGGGLSSSATVGVAYLLALEHVNGLRVTEIDNVELVRLIENVYLGLKIGVLDQSAILLSQQHCLSLIHCKNLEYEIIPPRQHHFESFKILIAFSGLRHALSSKPGYNMRVKECQDAARILLKLVGRESSEALLSNVTPEEYSKHKGEMEGTLARRAEHFFTEHERVFAGIQEWRKGNIVEFGKLMSRSGQSSIENYECGCEPLIHLREILLDAPGVYGARFSGAGFRGCCVAFVAPDKAEEAVAYVDKMYKLAQPELAKEIKETPIAVICESANKAYIL
ncbi:galacturonokinase [Marchantia polymorpha subsp. ruderalis]|uniref:Galactokinase n=1 Tax=Marchantia polymorpha TaxID=3197 RepID=A0A2R6W8P8_MARPO|nr:hypothetical protein MARPO_0128s0021 [Marchantia polymorpha]PTQ30199.1 hypothetical protein MARPO_0128s0021 [Marchantia polymorpha]BBN02895.1 hypothetical protein Mp_2g19060 [Marchantia polymorpha subsp. ruderalis]BBN02896.1 hypothetical protein Mp_2g19060 [Marchantia polymorpha subsp. ruderalis]|eukprot:PTQ30198.1 hypothetical protein MARPO_0128s0021 [Marchantia polymorpha]